jgi:exodeoxyribonuclease VII small subunit
MQNELQGCAPWQIQAGAGWDFSVGVVYITSMPKKTTTAPLAADGALPYEAAYARLETLVDSLESGEVSLADLVAKFEEGHHLLKTCQDHLRAAELKIEKLKLDDAGVSAFEPLDEESES